MTFQPSLVLSCPPPNQLRSVQVQLHSSQTPDSPRSEGLLLYRLTAPHLLHPHSLTHSPILALANHPPLSSYTTPPTHHLRSPRHPPHIEPRPAVHVPLHPAACYTTRPPSPSARVKRLESRRQTAATHPHPHTSTTLPTCL
jgi:hypothetical protein